MLCGELKGDDDIGKKGGKNDEEGVENREGFVIRVMDGGLGGENVSVVGE